MQAVTTKDDVLCVGSSGSMTEGRSSLPKGKRAVLWSEQAELNHPLDVLLLNRTPVKGRASAAGLPISVSALSPWLSPGLEDGRGRHRGAAAGSAPMAREKGAALGEWSLPEFTLVEEAPLESNWSCSHTGPSVPWVMTVSDH